MSLRKAPQAVELTSRCVAVVIVKRIGLAVAGCPRTFELDGLSAYAAECQEQEELSDMMALAARLHSPLGHQYWQLPKSNLLG